MLQFYYDFLDVYCSRTDFQLLQMDTDSSYFALSRESLEVAIKPSKRAAFHAAVYDSCRDGADFQPDASLYWLPRCCCQRHSTFDSKTPGLFKLEFEGTAMVNLCSKMYAVENADTAQSKHSSKGLSRKAVRDTCLDKGGVSVIELYKSVLDSGVNAGGANVGFKVLDNSMVTYTQWRNGICYFYPKRKVLADRVTTEPLEITLKPV